MQDEFELTYLIKEIPAGVYRSPMNEILDIYIPAGPDHAILRIRKSGEKYEITKKQPVQDNDFSHQTENTIPLTVAEYADLAIVPGKRVRKFRYYYTEGDTKFEIDVFQDGLIGLVLADVEFSSNDDKAKFTPPTWILADVTQERFITGGELCGKSYADIESELTTYNYKKLLS